MAQLIDKDTLVAEIENKIEKYTKRGEESDAKRDGYGMYWGGVLSCLNEVRTLCDTLKVKEVQEESISKDLGKAAKNYTNNIDNICGSIGEQARHAFKTGAQWQKKQLIEKACEYLEENLLDFWSQKITNTDYFIEDFKQAMEE